MRGWTHSATFSLSLVSAGPPDPPDEAFSDFFFLLVLGAASAWPARPATARHEAPSKKLQDYRSSLSRNICRVHSRGQLGTGQSGCEGCGAPAGNCAITGHFMFGRMVRRAHGHLKRKGPVVWIQFCDIYRCKPSLSQDAGVSPERKVAHLSSAPWCLSHAHPGARPPE